MATLRNPEYKKAELTFDINAFNENLELSGIRAWTREILRILFMEKGTMPSDPNMGCNITQESYNDIQTLKNTVKNYAETQIRLYLPDIPFMELLVYSEDELIDNGNTAIVYYIIKFQPKVDEIRTVTVASKLGDKVIDFEIKF